MSTLDFSQALARPFMEMSPYPMFVFDGAGGIRVVNGAASAYFALSASTLVGQNALDMLPPHRREQYEKHFRAWLAGDPYPTRFVWKRDVRKEVFLVFAARIAFADQAALLVSLVPAVVVEAALGGRIATAASQARAWVTDLARGAEERRSGFSREGDAELLKLTNREWEIARRLTEGDRVSLLSEDLGISVNTIRNHLKSIFRKLKLRSQSELVRRVRRARRSAP
jgi:PAS domain S-box-containing protein